MKALTICNLIFSVIFLLCYANQIAYFPIAWRRPRKKRAAVSEQTRRYAVLICARNEQTVIADLLENLHAQTYPSDCLHIFVLADNCTDDTAAIARAAGATVYERQDTSKIGKSYALDALLRHIKEDYPQEFDGYFVFDADNLLAPDYIEQMDCTFSEGHDVVVGYRNSKNYGDNWLSAGYALWFLRESRYLNYPRELLGSCCVVMGTGFLFSKSIADELDGWPFHTLTEDIEFTVSQMIQKRRIAFCREAELFDEQPVCFWQSWSQRRRWSRGYLQVFRKYGKDLLLGIFRGNFACYDMTMTIMPAFVLSTLAIVCNAVLITWGFLAGMPLSALCHSAVVVAVGTYIMLFLVGAIMTATEWRHIHTTTAKKIKYLFTFPFFVYTYIPIALSALFWKAEWKPIIHTRSITRMKEVALEQRKRQKRRRAVALLLAAALLLGSVGALAINRHVKTTGEAKILTPDQAAALTDVDCILVLGCLAYDSDTPSAMLGDRLAQGVTLYKNGTAPKLLMSGDHGRTDYNEVLAMKRYAMKEGVPSEDVFMDHAGFSTYESMYRAKEVFGAEKIVIVTQRYHLSRAIYVAESLGLEAFGVDSDLQPYAGQQKRDVREVLARVKDFATSVLKPKPTYLGEKIPISGSGDATNDEEIYV